MFQRYVSIMIGFVYCVAVVGMEHVLISDIRSVIEHQVSNFKQCRMVIHDVIDESSTLHIIDSMLENAVCEADEALQFSNVMLGHAASAIIQKMHTIRDKIANELLIQYRCSFDRRYIEIAKCFESYKVPQIILLLSLDKYISMAEAWPRLYQQYKDDPVQYAVAGRRLVVSSASEVVID